jgi:dimethylargininase
VEIAITRQVSRSVVNCELAFLPRVPIDVGRARRQHSEYESTLKDLGVGVLSLPEEPALPDSVFIEDTALVLDECAIILRPGAESRRAETDSVAAILSRFREVIHIRPPAHVDGGDILRIGRSIHVGLSSRSDAAAVGQMKDILAPLGYEVRAVEVRGCLHLKSAATQVAAGTVLVNTDWIDPEAFEGVKKLQVDTSEPRAANALLVAGTAICAASFPRTRELLTREGIPTRALEADELAKAEGALTCCSLIFQV